VALIIVAAASESTSLPRSARAAFVWRHRRRLQTWWSAGACVRSCVRRRPVRRLRRSSGREYRLRFGCEGAACGRAGGQGWACGWLLSCSALWDPSFCGSPDMRYTTRMPRVPEKTFRLLLGNARCVVDLGLPALGPVSPTSAEERHRLDNDVDIGAAKRICKPFIAIRRIFSRPMPSSGAGRHRIDRRSCRRPSCVRGRAGVADAAPAGAVRDCCR
jgi:hypothetical protein